MLEPAGRVLRRLSRQWGRGAGQLYGGAGGGAGCRIVSRRRGARRLEWICFTCLSIFYITSSTYIYIYIDTLQIYLCIIYIYVNIFYYTILYILF